MAENILMHQCVHFLFTAQIDHLTFAPPVFRSSFTLESVRAHFFLHSPSSSPLFFFFFLFFLARVKLKIVDRNENSSSLFFSPSPRLLLLLALLIFDWNQRSAQILGPLCSWELYDSSRFRPIFCPLSINHREYESCRRKFVAFDIDSGNGLLRFVIGWCIIEELQYRWRWDSYSRVFNIFFKILSKSYITFFFLYNGQFMNNSNL